MSLQFNRSSRLPIYSITPKYDFGSTKNQREERRVYVCFCLHQHTFDLRTKHGMEVVQCFNLTQTHQNNVRKCRDSNPFPTGNPDHRNNLARILPQKCQHRCLKLKTRTREKVFEQVIFGIVSGGKSGGVTISLQRSISPHLITWVLVGLKFVQSW